MLSKQAMLFIDQRLPWCRIFITSFTSRMRLQLHPALIIFIHWLPEGCRVCGMDQYRYVKLAAFFPDSIQPLIINRYPFA